MLRVALKKLARKLVRKKVKKFAFDHCKTCSERFVMVETSKRYRVIPIMRRSIWLRMCTLIFWMMTEGKMQSFLKKHFMRKRIWIHRCMYSRKIIILLPMKSIRNFWQKCWQIQRCGHCSIHWRRR